VDLEYDHRARRELAKLPTADARAIIGALERFAATGIGDLKKLKGITPPAWRLRAGKWRAKLRFSGSSIIVISGR